MAPEQAAGKRVDERVDLYSLALVLYEALAGTHPVRAGSPAATARRVGSVLAPLRRSRKDLPDELCAAIDQALRPKPDERGTLAELAEELAAALPEVSDLGGTVAPHPLEERTAPLPRGLARAAAALLAGGIVAAALAWSGQPALPALAAVVAVALFPRIGWLAAAAATVAVIAAEQPGRRAARGRRARSRSRCSCAATAPPGRSPRSPRCSGSRGLAGAYPALAGRARRWHVRIALGALGAWWALLAAPLLGQAILVTGRACPPARISRSMTCSRRCSRTGR